MWLINPSMCVFPCDTNDSYNFNYLTTVECGSLCSSYICIYIGKSINYIELEGINASSVFKELTNGESETDHKILKVLT